MVGWAPRVFVASLVLASGCGAVERNPADGEQASTAGFGGTNGSSGLHAGAPASGGSAPSSSAGVGGAIVPLPRDECACADERFGVSLVAEGELVELAFNVPGQQESSCEWRAAPLRGHTYWGCGGPYLNVRACASESGGFPCLWISGRKADYLDGQGRMWTGEARGVAANAETAYSAGTASLDLTHESTTRTLSMTFRLCGAPGPVVPC